MRVKLTSWQFDTLLALLQNIVETDPGKEYADKLMWVVLQGFYKRIHGHGLIYKKEYKLTIHIAEQLALAGWLRGVQLDMSVWIVVHELINNKQPK